MSAMGFYPVDPSSPNYILGSPIFDEVTIHMGNGSDLKIIAGNNSDRNAYIQSATLNGKAWNKTYFSHADIVDGGVLVLTMGPQPNRKWGTAPDSAPPSMSDQR
jgi:putative alpha-1,2-mannosidase